MKSLLFASALLCLFVIGGQSVSLGQSPKVFKVRAGHYPEKEIPYASRFQNAAFQTGTAEFINGRSSQASFNYSYLGGNILFLAANKDTLEIIDKALLKKVEIQGKTYHFDKRFGYCEILRTFSKAKIGKREVLTKIGTEKGGPYGISYTASSVTTYKSYSNDQVSSTKQLTANAEGVFTYRTFHFLIDNNNRFYIPTANTVSKLFPGHKRQITGFIKENKVNFGNEEDLSSLLAFCEGLIVKE
jgi:hypothetical protein